MTFFFQDFLFGNKSNNEIGLCLIEHLVGLTKELRLVASFTDSQEALEFLQTHADIDLVLLDVEMPGLSGLETMRRLSRPHPAVIVSSHRDFALEAFDLHVAAYLLKPLEYLHFREAVRRLGPPPAGARPHRAAPARYRARV